MADTVLRLLISAHNLNLIHSRNCLLSNPLVVQKKLNVQVDVAPYPMLTAAQMAYTVLLVLLTVHERWAKRPLVYLRMHFSAFLLQGAIPKTYCL